MTNEEKALFARRYEFMKTMGWYRWFAWYPVYCEGRWIWRREVTRRACAWDFPPAFCGYEYTSKSVAEAASKDRIRWMKGEIEIRL